MSANYGLGCMDCSRHQNKNVRSAYWFSRGARGTIDEVVLLWPNIKAILDSKAGWLDIQLIANQGYDDGWADPPIQGIFGFLREHYGHRLVVVNDNNEINDIDGYEPVAMESCHEQFERMPFTSDHVWHSDHKGLPWGPCIKCGMDYMVYAQRQAAKAIELIKLDPTILSKIEPLMS